MHQNPKVRNARGDTASYIADLLKELIMLAEKANLPKLVYTLRVAEGEASIQERLLQHLPNEV